MEDTMKSNLSNTYVYKLPDVPIKKVVSTILFISAFIVFFTITLKYPTSFDSPGFFIGVSLITTTLVVIAMHLDGYFEDKFEYHNSNQAKVLCAEITSKAKKEVIALGGECNSEFYDENDSMISSLQQNAEKGIHTRFLFGPNFDINSLTLLKLARENKIKMRRLKRRWKGEHFKIADIEFLYVGNPHEMLDIERTGYIMRSPRNALKKKILFEEEWKKSEKFDVDEMVLKATEFPEKYLEPGWLKNYDGEWGKTAGFIKKSKWKRMEKK